MLSGFTALTHALLLNEIITLDLERLEILNFNVFHKLDGYPARARSGSGAGSEPVAR